MSALCFFSPGQCSASFSQYYALTFGIVFLLKLFASIFTVVQFGRIEVFLLDWETQRLYANPEDNLKGISEWRALFVANQFCSLSVERKVSV